jgi:hypothetical protein
MSGVSEWRGNTAMDFDINSAFRLWNDFTSWNAPVVVMNTILSFGILSAWIMTRFVAAPPLFAGPICFIALSFAAMFSNFMARGVGMMGVSDLQRALLFTVVGHAVAAILLLAIFKVGEKGASR